MDQTGRLLPCTCPPAFASARLGKASQRSTLPRCPLRETIRSVTPSDRGPGASLRPSGASCALALPPLEGQAESGETPVALGIPAPGQRSEVDVTGSA